MSKLRSVGKWFGVVGCFSMATGVYACVMGFKDLINLVFAFAGLFVATVSAKGSAESAKASARSADISSATQQPRMIVDQMYLTHFNTKADGSLEAIFWCGLMNHGATGAEIISRRCTFLLANDNPELPQFSVPEGRLGLREMQAQYGEFLASGKPINLELYILLSPVEVQNIREAKTKLWVFGCLSYRDYLDEPWIKCFAGVLPFLQRVLGTNQVVGLVRPQGDTPKYEFTARGYLDQAGKVVRTVGN